MVGYLCQSIECHCEEGFSPTPACRQAGSNLMFRLPPASLRSQLRLEVARNDTLLLIIFAFALLCFCALCIGSAHAQATSANSESISLDLKGVDIVELFKVLSLKTGLTIVPQSNIKGRVNLFLNNVRFEDALDIILITNHLACEKKGNIVNIMTAEQYYNLYGKKYEEKRKVVILKLENASPVSVFNTLSQLKSDIGKIIVDESSGTVVLVDVPEKLDLMQEMVKHVDDPVGTETFYLKNSKVKDMEKEVTKALSPGSGTLFVDERTSKLQVKDMPGRIKSIKRLVRAFDEQPTAQVMIEAEIIELSLSEKFQRGVEWEKIFRDIQDIDIKGNFSLGLTDTRQEVSVGTLTSDDYNVILQLLQTYGRTRIISQPRIAALNNEEAKILVGSREAYITQTLSSAETSTTTAESIEYIDVGVKFNVTPTISRDGFVLMKIKPEVSSVREYLTTQLGSRIPIVNTSEAETFVKVKSGAMIMIAGLSKKKDLEETKSIPILSKIPLLGLLFSRHIRGPDEPRNSEFIVFITPKIISGESLASDETGTSEVALEKAPKGFKE